jgi:hypothetical protein
MENTNYRTTRSGLTLLMVLAIALVAALGTEEKAATAPLNAWSEAASPPQIAAIARNDEVADRLTNSAFEEAALSIAAAAPVMESASNCPGCVDVAEAKSAAVDLDASAQAAYQAQADALKAATLYGAPMKDATCPTCDEIAALNCASAVGNANASSEALRANGYLEGTIAAAEKEAAIALAADEQAVIAEGVEGAI